MPPASRGRHFCIWVTDANDVNLNTATAAEIDALAALKGHGFEIVRYRQQRGGFTALRQLDEVPGLAGKTDGLETLVTIGSLPK